MHDSLNCLGAMPSEKGPYQRTSEDTEGQK